MPSISDAFSAKIRVAEGLILVKFTHKYSIRHTFFSSSLRILSVVNSEHTFPKKCASLFKRAFSDFLKKLNTHFPIMEGQSLFTGENRLLRP